MVLNYLIYLVLGLNTILSALIFLRDPKAKVNIYYVLFVTFLDVWILSNFLENAPGVVGIQGVALFLKFDFSFAIILLYAWQHFCQVFVQEEIPFEYELRIVDRILGGIGAIFVALCFFSSYILRNITFSDNLIQFDSGPLWIYYAILLLVFAFGGLLMLYLGRRRARRNGHRLLAQQINFVFAGFALSIGFAIFINLFLQTFFPISLQVSRLGLYGMVALVALTAYGMVRQHLFEFRSIVVRAFSFLLLISALAGTYGALLVLGLGDLLHLPKSPGFFLAYLILFIIGTVSFQALYQFIKRTTNRYFFRGDYDSDVLLFDLTRIMAETLSLRDLEQKVLEKLSQSMGVENAAFILVKDDNIESVERTRNGKHFLARPDILRPFMKGLFSREIFIFEESREDDLKNILRQEGIAMVVPIAAEDLSVALLVLGPKSSGGLYREKDRNLLGIFSSESGIAIQNAKAYEQIRLFSRDLENRVAERTKQLEASQHQALDQAHEVARLKDEFVFFAVHELRAPVSAIRGFLELTTSTKTKFPAAIRDNLQAISQASDHLNQLINDLLEVAGSESGAMVLEAKPCEVREVVTTVIKETASLAKEKKIKVSMDNFPVSLSVICDSGKFKEIMMNLLSNAIKYNRNGGMVNIAARHNAKNNLVEFEVRDNGYGIPADQQDKIFNRFFRAQTKETQDVLGTGLGLFICRMLVGRMGGAISFKSTLGEGTTFTFTLPSASAQNESAE